MATYHLTTILQTECENKVVGISFGSSYFLPISLPQWRYLKKQLSLSGAFFLSGPVCAIVIFRFAIFSSEPPKDLQGGPLRPLRGSRIPLRGPIQGVKVFTLVEFNFSVILQRALETRNYNKIPSVIPFRKALAVPFSYP